MIERRWIAGLALALGACGSGNGPGPTTMAPQIICPADVTVRGITGSEQTATYTAPAVTGGTPQVTTTCTPASGASFPLGTTSVNCVAIDAQVRQATCAFKVTLTAAALTVTRYEAAGDSLTEGETGRPNVVPSVLDVPNAYPTKLQQLFDATYPGQGVVVINRGHSGDTVGRTLEELPQNLIDDRPGAVLLLTGYNNLTLPCAPGRARSDDCENAVDQVAIGIRDCIHRVKESSVPIKYTFVSTLTPPGATGSNRIDGNAIVEANLRIRQVVAAEAVVLVDSYASFVGHESEYVNVDGLHLRPAGYQKLADGFFAAIKATVPANPLFTGLR